MSDALKRTPLYEEHLALGARMVPFAGWEMPVQYAGIIEEHKAVRSSAGVFDVCHMAEFRVFGFGAFDFLQRLLTNDLHRIAELGQAQYTLMLRRGRPHHRRPHRLPHGRPRVPDHRQRLERRDRLRVAHRARARRPRARRRVRPHRAHRAAGPEGARASSTELAGRGLGAAGALHDRARRRSTRVPALVARTGYTGEDGVEIVCRASDAPRALARAPLVSRGHARAVSARATRCGSRWATRCTAATWTARSIPISAGLGWVVPEGEDAASSAPRRSPRCARPGPRAQARRPDGRRRDPAPGHAPCCTRARRWVR